MVTAEREEKVEGEEAQKIAEEKHRVGLNFTEFIEDDGKVVSSGNFGKDTEVYLNYLKQDLLVEEAGIFVKLRAVPFFAWIDVDNPWRKKTFFERLFKK